MYKSWIIPAAAVLFFGSVYAAEKIGSENADLFRDRVDRIYRCYGNLRPVDTPPGNRTAVSAVGDEILAGKIRIYRKPHEIGKTGIDWTGAAWQSREHTACLNRMDYLSDLAGAWQETRNAAYSMRAAELIGDWLKWVAAARRNEPELFDPDRNNQLNAALRLHNWIDTLARLRNAPGFDDRFADRMVAEIIIQGNALQEHTEAGPGNWPIFQASALLEAALAFDFLPESVRWRRHAVEVLDRSFILNFGPDGVHRENTPNYHYGPAWHFSNAYNLQHEYPELQFRNLTREAFRKIMDFSALSQPFPFNDTGYRQYVSAPVPGRYAPGAPAMVDWATCKLGLTDWKLPEYGFFPEAGLLFGGNARERIFFDAGRFGSWHCHYSRLEFCLNRDGFVLIADPGISTYNWQNPEKLPMFAAGRETAAHPTLNFDRACQLRRGAEMLDCALGPDFAWALGEYQGGYYPGSWKNHVPENKTIDAVHRRAVVWIAGEYALLLDRVKADSAPNGEKSTVNLEFPLAPMEKWSIDPKALCFVTENNAMPNLSIQLIGHPEVPVELSCEEGVAGPPMRGWLFADAETPVKAPWVEFRIPAGLNETSLVTLIASSPLGQKTPQFTVAEAREGAIDLTREDGSCDFIRYAPDLRRIRPLSGGGVTRECSLLAVRRDAAGNTRKVFVARMPQVGPIQDIRLFTGFLAPHDLELIPE